MISLPRHHIGLYVAAALALLTMVAPASAEQGVLGGKYSKDDIKSRCAAVGGLNVEGTGGKGYGCYNPNKGTMVACADSGTCTGYTPPQKP